jgi:RNA polymerase sigma factor (TIGR02999 family)
LAGRITLPEDESANGSRLDHTVHISPLPLAFSTLWDVARLPHSKRRIARKSTMTESTHLITELLSRWKTGDRSIEAELITIVYPVLRGIATLQVRQHSGLLTLQATELANEAFITLARKHAIDWQDRNHFFAIAATVIRRIVVDYLRQRGCVKRGGRLPLVALDELHEDQTPAVDESVDWIGVDEALTALAGVDCDCARVVELKFFSGLTTEKIAEVCGSSVATVGRQWRFARAWLVNRLGAEASPT